MKAGSSHLALQKKKKDFKRVKCFGQVNKTDHMQQGLNGLAFVYSL